MMATAQQWISDAVKKSFPLRFTAQNRNVTTSILRCWNLINFCLTLVEFQFARLLLWELIMYLSWVVECAMKRTFLIKGSSCLLGRSSSTVGPHGGALLHLCEHFINLLWTRSHPLCQWKKLTVTVAEPNLSRSDKYKQLWKRSRPAGPPRCSSISVLVTYS